MFNKVFLGFELVIGCQELDSYTTLDGIPKEEILYKKNLEIVKYYKCIDK